MVWVPSDLLLPKRHTKILRIILCVTGPTRHHPVGSVLGISMVFVRPVGRSAGQACLTANLAAIRLPPLSSHPGVNTTVGDNRFLARRFPALLLELFEVLGFPASSSVSSL